MQPRPRCAELGIDSDAIVSLAKAHGWAAHCATSHEVFGVMDAAKVDYATVVMLIVSAKHTLYEALYPQVGRSIAYLDASIDDVQPSPGRFRARLKVSLSQAWVGGTW